MAITDRIIPHSINSLIKYRDELSMVIDHTFKNSEDIYICLTIPFTFSDNELYLR